MSDTDLRVLVVEDDFRVANMHAGIIDALPGFSVSEVVNTLAAARNAEPVDLALVDVYLPDGSGIDFVRELRCDSIVLSAATEADTIRAAMARSKDPFLGCEAGCPPLRSARDASRDRTARTRRARP